MIQNAKTAVKKGKATELSQKVADILFRLRSERGVSQRDFAEIVGVSFQQYQKYEKGRDRLSLEKAMLLCTNLDIPLDTFRDFETAGFAETNQAAFGQKTLSNDERELVALFNAVPKKAKADFMETVRRLAKMTSGKN